MRSHAVPCVTHRPHHWCPRTVCFSPPQGTWSLKSHVPALPRCLCAPSRGRNNPRLAEARIEVLCPPLSQWDKMLLPAPWTDSRVHLRPPEAQWGPGGRAARKPVSQCPEANCQQHMVGRAAAGTRCGGPGYAAPSVCKGLVSFLPASLFSMSSRTF